MNRRTNYLKKEWVPRTDYLTRENVTEIEKAKGNDSGVIPECERRQDLTQEE